MQIWGTALATAHANINPYVDDTKLFFTPLAVVANWAQLRKWELHSYLALNSSISLVVMLND